MLMGNVRVKGGGDDLQYSFFLVVFNPNEIDQAEPSIWRVEEACLYLKYNIFISHGFPSKPTKQLHMQPQFELQNLQANQVLSLLFLSISHF